MQGARPFLIVRVVAVVWIVIVAVMSLMGSDFGGRAQSSIGDIAGERRIVGTVDTQEIRDEKSHWTLRDLFVDGREVGDRLLLFAASTDQIESGDRVSVYCNVEPSQPINGFRYDRLLASRDVYATCFSRDTPTLLTRQHPTVIDRLHVWREMIVRRIADLYAPDSAALLSGLLIGTQTFSDDWSETFRAAGVSHIVAASGSNVDMVVKMLSGLLIVFGVSRRRSALLLGTGIFSYVILAGAGAPVIRAAILASLLVVAYQLGRRSIASHLLLVTISVMLVFQPLLLLYDVGFQLSVLSTWALISVAPRIQQWLKNVPGGPFLADILSSTIAITIVTAPLLLWTFGSISLVAIVANVFILPLVAPAMIFGAFSLLFVPITILADLFLRAILFLAQFFSRFPYASFTISYVDALA